jgi:uncharacterized membrane protein
MSDDRVDELYEKLTEVCRGFAAADVVYALGMMIADAVVLNAVDKNPDVTFKHLRNVVEIEIPMVGIREGAAVSLQEHQKGGK